MIPISFPRWMLLSEVLRRLNSATPPAFSLYATPTATPNAPRSSFETLPVALSPVFMYASLPMRVPFDFTSSASFLTTSACSRASLPTSSMA